MKEPNARQFEIRLILRNQWIQRLLTGACLILALAGCGTPTIEKDPRIEALTNRLGEIETVHLENQSKSEPVSIEQATKKTVEEISEPNKAGPTVELALEEVRAAALVNNLDLKVELVDPSIAQRTLDAERAKFESTFFLAARHHRMEGADNAAASTSDSYEGGINVPLHAGGSVSLNIPTSDAESGAAAFDGVSEAALSVSYIQSLLRGAGTAVNMYSIRMASHQRDIVDAGTKLAAINILANADIAYWRLFVAHRQLQVRREQYKLAQNQLDHARRKVRAGAAPQNEIIRAEAGLSSRLEGVLNAETQLRNCERDLKAIMNRSEMPVDSPIMIVTTTQPNPLGLDLDADAMAKAAFENRMEMVQVALGLAIDDLNIKLARNATLPALSFDYTHTLANESGSIGRAIGQLANGPSQDYSLGLLASFPIGNEAPRARLQSARLTRLQRLTSRERLQITIRQVVYQAVDQLEQSWRRILAAKQGVEAAHRNYRVEQSQFELGQRTSTEVLYATESLADAQMSEIHAFADYEIAKVLLSRATGTLLGYGRIQLQPIDLESEGNASGQR